MTQAKPGDKLRLHYTGTLDDGTVFDTSAGSEPLEFTLGAGEIIPGLDEGVTGMSVGETRSVRVEPADAYGEHDPDRVQAVPLSQVPEDIPTETGTQLQVQTSSGQVMNVTVAGKTDSDLLLDTNHPLAGKALTFDVELVEIA
jgi:peptidylprolyl isomerase